MSAGNEIARVLTPVGRREVASEQLGGILAGLTAPDCPVTWIHAGVDPLVVQALDDMGLGEIAVKSLRDGPERPRVEEFADHLYVSLFSVEAPPGVLQGTDGPAGAVLKEDTAPGPSKPDLSEPELPEPESLASESLGPDSLEFESAVLEFRALRLFLGPRWLVSVGRLSDSDYEVLAARVARQVFSRDRGPSFVAYHICEWVIETMQPVLDRLDDRLDAIEDQVVTAPAEGVMQELFNLKRSLVDLRRRVAPLRDVFQRLGSHGVVYVDPLAEVYFRDVHDDAVRDIELLDTYRDILSSALDLHLSSISNRLNQVMKQLTVVATMFLPLTFIVGLFGTNFTDMPYKSVVLFILMFVFMVVSVAVIFFYTRRRT